jgi:hypothetical protein
MRAILAIVLSLYISTALATGQDRGNPGDANVMEFVNSGTRAINFLKRNPNVAVSVAINPDLLLTAMRKVRVEIKTELFLDGIEVDAINYPNQGLIQLSLSRWVATSNSPDAFLKKQNLALHEYLWVLGYDDTNYKISSVIAIEIQKEWALLQPSPTSSALAVALCAAIASRDYQTAASLLQLKFDVNQDCNGSNIKRINNYALYNLIFNLQNSEAKSPEVLNMVERLLMAGADPNRFIEMPYWDVRILSATIRFGYFEIAKLLVQYGADPNLQGLSKGQVRPSAFHEAITGNVKILTPEFLRWMIEAGADLNLQVETDALLSKPSGIQTAACEILESGREDLRVLLLFKMTVDRSLCTLN